MPAPEEIPFKVYTRQGQTVKVLGSTFGKYDRREDFQEWEQNIPFYGTIRIVGYHGKNIHVEREDNGTLYWITPSYLVTLVTEDRIRDSRVTGNWQVFKQGSALNLKLVQ